MLVSLFCFILLCFFSFSCFWFSWFLLSFFRKNFVVVALIQIGATAITTLAGMGVHAWRQTLGLTASAPEHGAARTVAVLVRSVNLISSNARNVVSYTQ